MEKYNYKETVCDDVREYISGNCNPNELRERLNNDRNDLYNELYDDMFADDSVTGNASGSYYCNAWKAEESLCHNLELLREAIDELGGDYSVLDSAESCDVMIRCHLLGQCLDDVLDELENESME